MSNFSQKIDFDFRIIKPIRVQTPNWLVPIRQFVLVGNSNSESSTFSNQDECQGDIDNLVYEILMESRALYCSAFSIFFDLTNSVTYQVLALTDSTVRLIEQLPEGLSEAKTLAITNIEKAASKALENSKHVSVGLIESLISTLITALKLLRKAFNLFTQSYLLILTTVCLGGGLLYASPKVIAVENENLYQASSQTKISPEISKQSLFNNQTTEILATISSSSSSESSSSSQSSEPSTETTVPDSVTYSASSAVVADNSSSSSEKDLISNINSPTKNLPIGGAEVIFSKTAQVKAASNINFGSSNFNIENRNIAAKSTKFVWPVRGAISRCDLPGHLACDIANSIGTPIGAATSGIIEEAGWKAGGFGNMIQINHGGGLKTIYMHLSSVHVTRGQFVNQSDQIGLLGSTGNSTGPHLHFGVFVHNVEVDPFNYLP